MVSGRIVWPADGSTRRVGVNTSYAGEDVSNGACLTTHSFLGPQSAHARRLSIIARRMSTIVQNGSSPARRKHKQMSARRGPDPQKPRCPQIEGTKRPISTEFAWCENTEFMFKNGLVENDDLRNSFSRQRRWSASTNVASRDQITNQLRV